MAKHGLKLKPNKCHLFQPSVQYLGHVVPEKGVTPMEEKVTQPTTVKELRGFLGLIGYYRRFIQNFAKVAAPLHALVVGCPQKQTCRASPPLTKWTPECEVAFKV